MATLVGTLASANFSGMPHVWLMAETGTSQYYLITLLGLQVFSGKTVLSYWPRLTLTWLTLWHLPKSYSCCTRHACSWRSPPLQSKIKKCVRRWLLQVWKYMHKSNWESVFVHAHTQRDMHMHGYTHTHHCIYLGSLVSKPMIGRTPKISLAGVISHRIIKPKY